MTSKTIPLFRPIKQKSGPKLGHDDVDGFVDAHMGEWKSEENFAWHIYEECYKHEMSEFASHYFNERLLQEISSPMIIELRSLIKWCKNLGSTSPTIMPSATVSC